MNKGEHLKKYKHTLKELNDKAKRLEERKTKKYQKVVKKIKKITLSKAKARAWKQFSLYIRLRDCLETTGTKERLMCCTCRRLVPFKQAQAGHFIGGRTNSILFIESNCHGQDVGCNVFLRGNYDRYLIFMLDKYGEEWVRYLANQKNEIKKYTVQDLLEKEAYYKEKYEALLARP